MSNLVRFNNRRTLPTLSSWMEDWFGSDYPDSREGFNTGKNLPAVNIRENESEYAVEVAAPGMSRDDFEINLDNNLLTISSEKQEENEENDGERFTRREFSYTSFRRTFTLPDTVKAEDIAAKYNDGILNIKLPKREEAKKQPPRKIDIS